MPDQPAPACTRTARLAVCGLNGHYAHYGITGNIRRLQEYRYLVVRIWHKWLERRTRGRSFKWDNFNAFLTRHPLPAARIIHRGDG
jgi:RNA-directed DNA polymerase